MIALLPTIVTRFRAGCALLALAAMVAYANHFRNSFHFDDSHTVQSNLFIRDLRNLPRFFTDARTFSSLPSNQSYRPVVTATLAVDYALGGADPVAFHVDSFLWFLLECLVLGGLFRRILGNDWAALFGTALVALHPANAETVNYVIARSDVISALGAAACVWVWASFPRGRKWQLHLVPAALGVLAKEQGAMAAPLLFLYIGLIEQRRSLGELVRPRALWQALRPALPAFGVCAAAALLAMRMAPSWVPGGASRLHYALTQPWVTLHYFCMFLLPVQLSADTDWTAVSSPLDLRVFAGLAFVAAMVYAAVRASRSDATRPIAYGVLWFFVALLPSSSIVPLAEVMNDHRMHFALPGLALATACGFGLLAPRLDANRLRLVAVVGVSVLLVIAAVGTWRRNQVWRTEETLWGDVTEKSPGNGRGWMNYGLARMARGDLAGAEQAYVRSLSLAPQYGYLHVNLAILKGSQGDRIAAEQHFRRALELMPAVPAFRFFFARWLDEVGRSEEALEELRTAIALSPGESAAHEMRLRILERLRRWPELERAAQETLAARSNDATALAMLQRARGRTAGQGPTFDDLLADSVRLYQERRYEEMLRACNAALARRPDSAEAWNNRCSALNALRRYPEAAGACDKALELKPDFGLARNNLAVSRAGSQ